MSTYYKYAERQADSFVNWAEIGKDITDMLKPRQPFENKRRQLSIKPQEISENS
jgi:hypothetical protein